MSSSYGAKWPPYPAGPLYVDSQDVYANPETPLTVIGSGGAGPTPTDPNLVVSSLYVAGQYIAGGYTGLTMATIPGNPGGSLPILLNSVGQDNISSGQLSISKVYWPGINGETVRGLGVNGFSTVFGSFQPICCGDLYVNNGDGIGDGTGRITYVDALSTMSLTAAGATGNVTISSAVVSTINGTNWPALVSTVIGLNGGPI